MCEECQARQSPLDRRIGIEAGQVTAGLAELLALAGVEIAFEEATRWLEHYLLFQVSDTTLRKLGYFIGSGTVESAGKQIAGLRLKRTGARWTQQGARATAKARAAWLSGTWDVLVSRV